MSRPALTTLLVANRGEIACRIMRTAKAMGLTTVAVHSATDRDARHSREAISALTWAVPRPPKATCWSTSCWPLPRPAVPRPFTRAMVSFPRTQASPGQLNRPLIFLGPPASAIDAMGSKSAAKALMEAAGVPLVPGYHAKPRTWTPSARRRTHRLPSAAQGQRWRRRQGHESGRGRKPTGRRPGLSPA